MIWAFIQTLIFWFLLNLLLFDGQLPIGTYYRWLGGGLLLIFVAVLWQLWREGRHR